MTYKLSQRSLAKLEGIDARMIAVVKYAINVTKQDFSVICGMRTIEEQKVLVAKGASQTMKSKHIDGLAVDLMAYVNGGRWELNLYDEIADAMSEGAREIDVPIVWGAAWSVPNIAQYGEGNMEDAMNSYIDLRRSQGRRPFIDGPHFELVV